MHQKVIKRENGYGAPMAALTNLISEQGKCLEHSKEWMYACYTNVQSINQ
jgi:hypothetical protein